MVTKNKVEKVLLPDFKDYLPYINIEGITDAIMNYREGEPQLTEYDFKVIKLMIWSAGEHWLPRDMYDLQIEEIETENKLVIEPNITVKYTIDLQARTNGYIKPFDQFTGSRILCDWKTTGGGLSQDWKDRLVDSWQWKLYSRCVGSDIFIYRGVSRKCDFDSETCETREVIIAVPKTNTQEVDEYVRGVYQERKGLIDAGLEVWPRHMPKSCWEFNRQCPYYEDCINYTMPRKNMEEKELSYTYLERFTLCPEKARRLEIDSHGDDNESSNIGIAFHRGISNLYLQAKDIKL